MRPDLVKRVLDWSRWVALLRLLPWVMLCCSFLRRLFRPTHKNLFALNSYQAGACAGQLVCQLMLAACELLRMIFSNSSSMSVLSAVFLAFLEQMNAMYFRMLKLIHYGKSRGYQRTQIQGYIHYRWAQIEQWPDITLDIVITKLLSSAWLSNHGLTETTGRIKWAVCITYYMFDIILEY
jgi:hypothetical protein